MHIFNSWNSAELSPSLTALVSSCTLMVIHDISHYELSDPGQNHGIITTEYGMHIPWKWIDTCKMRKKSLGLFCIQ